jgi:hypothetical protein
VTLRRAFLFPLLLALGGFCALVPAGPAAASAQHCAAHPPRSAADYQAVPDQRNASFGIGDITSAVQLPDGRRFFTLGDTLYYNIASRGRAGALRGFGNNSAWVQSGNCFTLLDRAGPGSRSWLLPPQQDGSVYWPGGAVVVRDRLYVFLTRLFLDNPFGSPTGSAVAEFDLPSLALARITTVPFVHSRPLGAGAVYDGGYLYAYAAQGHTCKFCFAGDLYLARVRESQMHDLSAWRFRAGSHWVADRNAAQPVLANAVSNVDVQPYGNGYLLITKPLGIVAPEVEARWSPNPVGPWQDLGTVFTVPQPPPSYVAGFTYHESYTYGATVLARARLADGGVLALYNVNSFDPADGQRDGRMGGPRFVSVHLPPPPAAPPRVRVKPGPSPWKPTLGVDRSGRVYTAGGGVGSTAVHMHHAVGVARTPTAKGGWVAGANGGVSAFGDATSYGSMGGHHLNRPIVGIAATPTGKGYWLVASDGGIFSFGDAGFHGSTGGIHLNRPILAMAATPTGRGYWFVASDGGIFTFGDARFYGSTGGTPPPAPVTGMTATPDGRGYVLSTLTGRVYAFGDIHDAGNVGSPVTAPCVGIVAAPGGYRLVESNGDVYARGPTRGRQHISSPDPLVAAG